MQDIEFLANIYVLLYARMASSVYNIQIGPNRADADLVWNAAPVIAPMSTPERDRACDTEYCIEDWYLPGDTQWLVPSQLGMTIA